MFATYAVVPASVSIRLRILQAYGCSHMGMPFHSGPSLDYLTRPVFFLKFTANSTSDAHFRRGE